MNPHDPKDIADFQEWLKTWKPAIRNPLVVQKKVEPFTSETATATMKATLTNFNKF